MIKIKRKSYDRLTLFKKNRGTAQEMILNQVIVVMICHNDFGHRGEGEREGLGDPPQPPFVKGSIAFTEGGGGLGKAPPAPIVTFPPPLFFWLVSSCAAATAPDKRGIGWLVSDKCQGTRLQCSARYPQGAQ